MTTLVLTIDDDRIDDDQLAAALRCRPEAASSPDNATVDVDVLQTAFNDLPHDAIQVHRGTRHPDWERGAPCPECGNQTMSVLAVEEDLYDSSNGEFTFVKKGDALGPQLSVLCPDCMTHLEDVPYEKLAV